MDRGWVQVEMIRSDRANQIKQRIPSTVDGFFVVENLFVMIGLLVLREWNGKEQPKN